MSTHFVFIKYKMRMHKDSKQSKVALTGNFAPLGQAPETPYDVNAHT